MIDKKKLIKELLDCVANATDTETQITGITITGMLMNEVLDKALTIYDVSSRSKQHHCELYDFGRKDKPCNKQCDSCKVMNID